MTRQKKTKDGEALKMAVLVKMCPACGSVNIVKIVYGYPCFELFQNAEAGKVRLGGCCISDSDPEYFCRDCEKEWN